MRNYPFLNNKDGLRKAFDLAFTAHKNGAKKVTMCSYTDMIIVTVTF